LLWLGVVEHTNDENIAPLPNHHVEMADKPLFIRHFIAI